MLKKNGTSIKQAMDMAMKESVRNFIDKERLFDFEIKIKPTENKGLLVIFPDDTIFAYSTNQIPLAGKDLETFLTRILGSERAGDESD